MKTAVRETALVLLALAGAVFFVRFIFGKNEAGNLSIFDGVTGVVSRMQGTEPGNESASLLQSQGTDKAPEADYVAGAATAGTAVSFKELFEVTVNAQTFPGNEENGFAIYLSDITDLDGNSRLVFLDSESIDAGDEIYSDFIYDRDEDILYICSRGCYTVRIKVYTDTGYVTAYEFNLPVE